MKGTFVVLLVLLSGCVGTVNIYEGSPTGTPHNGRHLPAPLPKRDLSKGEYKIMETIFFGVKGEYYYVQQTNLDDWHAPLSAPLEGDCDDFAGAIVTLARLHGIPARRLTVLTEDGTYHMVAEAGGLIYDGLQKWPVLPGELNYRWLQGESYSGGWVNLQSED